jgi:RNA polymerase sigma-70 factor, ECF subfamily
MNFEKIYKEYQKKIYRYTYNYTKNPEEQKDLMQDIFYNIFFSLNNFKNKSSLNTYIYAIARNVCLNYIKKNINDRKIHENLVKNYEEKTAESAYETYEMSENMKYFFEVLEKLPEDQKDVFYLSEIENLKYEEIAKILNIPVGTVKSRLNRGKINIIKELEERNV